MITSLSSWMATWFDQIATPATKNVMEAESFEQFLLNNRIRSAARAWQMRNSDDGGFDVDTTTAQVEITMRDLTGDQQHYGADYIYKLHPDHFAVYVDDVEIDDHSYAYSPVSMDLVFVVPRIETDPTVTVVGHLVDFRAAMRDAGDMLVLRLSTLPSVKDREFEFLARRIRRAVNETFGARVIRKRKR